MKINEQHLLPAHLAFYRRRWFWSIIFGIFFLFSTVLFISFLDKNGGDYTHSFNQIFDSFNLAYGSILFMLYGFKMGAILGEVGSVTYFASILFLAYKTFQKDCVHLRYPVILSILYITGIIPLFFMNGF